MNNTATTSNTVKKSPNEAIKVCVRVRPLLKHEMHKDQSIYFPNQFGSEILQGIKVADG